MIPCKTLSGPRFHVLLLVLAGWVCLAGGNGTCSGQQADAPAASIEIPAWAFDRGNVRTFVGQYAVDGPPMVANGGVSPIVVEYDIELPVAATYTFHFNYAAAGSRPVDLLVDGKKVGACCGGTTGSWDTGSAKWEQSHAIPLAQGKHTVKLVRPEAFPHVVALRLDSPVAFPEDWKLDRPHAKKLPKAPFRPLVAKSLPDEQDIEALRLAIDDLAQSFGPRYPKAAEYSQRLAQLAKSIADLPANAEAETAQPLKSAFESLRRDALLANPLLDFDKLLLVNRKAGSPSLGLPRNWQSNSSLPKTGYDDQLMTLSPVHPDGELATVYHPSPGKFIGDVDLHFNADRVLFSMPGTHNRWQVFEMNVDGSGLRELTGEETDVDSYDACYLPSGKIIFTSTACFIGVPCVYGNSHVAVLYVMDADGKNIRQLCFDQEHDWCPTVLPNGRLLFTRWEYTDTPHSNTRLLFHMNPDGTQQMEYYGSNSYWPNSFFYTRPVPGHPTKVVSVIGGHHDNPRMGELVVFDPANGRREAEGAVQRIPGRDVPVEAIIRDGLTNNSWPKFLHPFPLSEKYFIVSCKPSPQSLWGIYLVDVFDNFTLIKELPGQALLEPIPLRHSGRPPVIPDKIDPASKTATVYIPDIYVGNGLKDIPRGTVKSMRVFTYHFSYQNMGGLLGVIGMDGPWDIKRVIGTVPVHPDGSVKFELPANTPVSLQPLDGEGKAMQLMRSWMTAMPGEVVSCVGCHESQNTAPPVLATMAASAEPVKIEPWYGPTRGFAYFREVQPTIDKYCVGCHDGGPRPDGQTIPNLRGDVKITDWRSITPGNGGGHAGKFSVGYAELHRFVRRPGIESDYHMLEPMEYHADTTQLVQMLKKGHHNVRLDAEAWDRLITWIDLNCPYHGTWGEELDNPGRQRERRRELLQRYANVDDDPEAVPEVSTEPIEPVMPLPLPPVPTEPVACPDWPLSADEAQARQQAAGAETAHSFDLGGGTALDVVLIPAGRFVMGSRTGAADERPLRVVAIDKPFWMGRFEVTNAMFALFDAEHDSRVESKNTYQFGIHGYPMNTPAQPAVRVSWRRAADFCQWLSQRTGRRFSLPSEAQWEYACRAGTATPMNFGTLADDFAKHANLADAKLTEFASNPYTVDSPLANPPKYDDWIPKDSRYNDGALLTVAPGSYQPNAWGLFDMHGNAAEWTTGEMAGGRKVVRGGSWRDRPKRATSSHRLGFQPYQQVYNVGFRVVCEVDGPAVVVQP